MQKGESVIRARMTSVYAVQPAVVFYRLTPENVCRAAPTVYFMEPRRVPTRGAVEN